MDAWITLKWATFSILAGVLATGPLASGQDEASSKSVSAERQADLSVEDILAGIAHERGRLLSGVYTAEGNETYYRWDRELDVASFEVSSAFCFPSQRMFIKHISDQDVLRRSGDPPHGEVMRLACWRPDCSLHFSGYERYPSLYIYPPGTLKPREMRLPIGYFDIRAVGMLGVDQHFQSVDFEQASERFRDGLVGPNPLRVSQDCEHLGDGLYRVRSQYGTAPLRPADRIGRRDVYVDTQRGFTIRQIITTSGFVADDGVGFVPDDEYFKDNPIDPSDARALKLREMSPLHSHQVDVGWALRSEVWVPTSLKQRTTEQQYDEDEQGELDLMTGRLLVHSIECSFEWSSVNQDLDDEYFDARNFGLPGGRSRF